MDCHSFSLSDHSKNWTQPHTKVDWKQTKWISLFTEVSSVWGRVIILFITFANQPVDLEFLQQVGMSVGKMLCQISLFLAPLVCVGSTNRLCGICQVTLTVGSVHEITSYFAPCFVHKPCTVSKTSTWNVSGHGSRSASHRESKQLFSTPSTAPGRSKSGTWNRTHTHTHVPISCRGWKQSATELHTSTEPTCSRRRRWLWIEHWHS